MLTVQALEGSRSTRGLLSPSTVLCAKLMAESSVAGLLRARTVHETGPPLAKVFSGRRQYSK